MFFTYRQKNTVLISTITDVKLLSAAAYIRIQYIVLIRRLLGVSRKAGFKHIVDDLNELQKLLQQERY